MCLLQNRWQQFDDGLVATLTPRLFMATGCGVEVYCYKCVIDQDAFSTGALNVGVRCPLGAVV